MNKIEKAKEILFKILREEDMSGDSSKIAQFHWKRNYGVYKDLPFYESDNSYYFEESKGIIPYDERDEKCVDYLKWFSADFNRGKLLFVPHITIFHKGAVKYVLIIVDGKDTPHSELKVMDDFFSGYWNCYQIEADDILNCGNLESIDRIKVKTIVDWWGEDIGG